MSASDYLRTKLASQQHIASTRKPTDSSEYTHKLRLAASSTFFVDGGSVGALRRNTDEAVLVGNSHPALSFKKSTTGKTPLASDYTSYSGHHSSTQDIIAQNTRGPKNLLCTSLPAGPVVKYTSASDHIRTVKCPDIDTGVQDVQHSGVFVDNTIRLIAGHPRMVDTDGCCDFNIEHPNHTHSPGIRVGVDNQKHATGKRFFMSNPPLPQGDNVNNRNKIGGYLGVRYKYVENKKGLVKPTDQIPKAPGPQGQQIEQLKINSPTFFIKN